MYTQYLQARMAFDMIVLLEERIMEIQVHIDALDTYERDIEDGFPAFRKVYSSKWY